MRPRGDEAVDHRTKVLAVSRAFVVERRDSPSTRKP
jgi:hypothetical protein